MNDNPVIAIGIILACFALTLFLTERLRTLFIRLSLLDHPNERSSHLIPVPRGGGWALVVVLGPVMLVAALIEHALPHYTGLLLGLTLLVAISWFDDRRGIHPAIRLALHLCAATAGSLSLAPSDFVFGHFLPFWLDRICVILAWGWFLNLYNFMDGIDGITGSETIAIATGVCLVMTATGMHDPFTNLLCLVLTGTCLGFLALNWSPAKIFMGDVGSIPLGYLTGFLLINLSVHGYFVAALILPLYYLADSGLTITVRASRGEKIWLPHRQHFYQRAALGIRRHATVVLRIILVNIVLIVASLLSLHSPATSLALAVLTVAILLGWMHKTSLIKGH